MATTIRKMTVTPTLAKQWLTLNKNNRSVSARIVGIYAADMAAGRWKCNGETIKLNCNRLLDGQHRLQAIIESGMPIETWVAEGMPDEVFDTLDTGKKRTQGDALAFAGAVDQNALAATLHIIWRYENGKMRGSGAATNAEIVVMMEKHPGVKDSISKCRRVTFIPASWLAASHYLLSKYDADIADDFVEKIITGEGLTKDSPILRLRNKLIESASSRNNRVARYYAIAMIIKAWNAVREGKSISRLALSDDETFPEII